MVKRILLLLVSMHTIQSSDIIIVKFPTILNTTAFVSGKKYSHTNETTVSDIVSASKTFYLNHMSQHFNETVRQATFFLAASYFCPQISAICYEESPPLFPDDLITDIKKIYNTDRFILNFGYKKVKRKRLVSTQ